MMTEPESPEDLSPEEAAVELGRLTRFEAALRQRTEGLTWAFWGFAVAGIFLSYGVAHDTFRDADWPLWAEALWAPWVLAGSAFTTAMWRSAALAAPRATEGPGAWTHLAYTALVVGMFTLVLYMAPAMNGQVVGLLVLGAVTLLLGVTNLFRSTRLGRAVTVAIGAVCLVAGAIEGSMGVGYDAATWVSVVVGGGSFLLGGLYVSLRG